MPIRATNRERLQGDAACHPTGSPLLLRIREELQSMFKTMAMVHSKKAQDEVTIIRQNGNNDIVAEYQGKRYTAIYNPFVGLYYVDDIYGLILD